MLFSDLAGAVTPEDREEILQRIVLLNAGVAQALARRYHRRGIDSEDLDQTAYLTLVLAARAFDPSRGHDFLSLAVPTILGGLKQHFRDHGWTIRVSRRAREQQVVWLRFGEDRTQRSIAAEVDLTQAQVSRILTRVMGELRAQLTSGLTKDSPRVVVSLDRAR